MTLSEATPKVQIISIQHAKESLGLKNSEFLHLLQEHEIEKVKNSRGKTSISIKDFTMLKEQVKQNRSFKAPAALKRTPEDRIKDSEELRSFQKEISENVKVNVRDRSEAPQKAIVFAGPTNSGKTYFGLEELFRDYEANPDKVHVYCGPLRLLAYEVYNKMVERYGEDKVGFITGEEALNPEAKLLACTCEMAPEEGHSILVDETHWLADPDRGHIWSRILISSKYDNFYIISAAEAIDVISKLTEDAWYSEIRTFERKTPISFKGFIELKNLQPKTAVVCFSRKTVYSVAKQLEGLGKKVGVLYGGLPLQARKRQIQAYLEGKYDIMVTTDVIGHGINLPIDNVVFVQTQKFDGKEVRDLYTWELAQIAGRAGRFGMSKEGAVYLARGLPWFSNDKDLIKEGTKAAGGKVRTDLVITDALVSPRLSDLGLELEGGTQEAIKVLPSLSAWKKQANILLQDRILKPSDLKTRTENVSAILKAIGAKEFPWPSEEKRLYNTEELFCPNDIDLTELWQLASGPYDANLGTINYISRWLTSPIREEDGSLKRFFFDKIQKRVEIISKMQLKEASTQIEMLEESIRINAELKMAMIMFGVESDNGRYLGKLRLADLLTAEEMINNIIIKILTAGIKNSSIGSCIKCGKPTKPWYKECDECHKPSSTKNLRYRNNHE